MAFLSFGEHRTWGGSGSPPPPPPPPDVDTSSASSALFYTNVRRC